MPTSTKSRPTDGGGGIGSSRLSNNGGGSGRLTGERPQQGVTPDSLLALHEAGYRAVLERLEALADGRRRRARRQRTRR